MHRTLVRDADKLKLMMSEEINEGGIVSNTFVSLNVSSSIEMGIETEMKVPFKARSEDFYLPTFFSIDSTRLINLFLLN